MFVARYYFVVAIVLATGAFFASGWYFSVVLSWSAVSVLLVSLAYVSGRADIFRKREDGSIPLYARWLFIPFLLGAQLYNGWARKRDTVPAIQKIEDDLFLACRLFPSDITDLKNKGINSIVDATAEFDGLDWSASGEGLAYLNIPVLDHLAPTDAQLRHAISWLDEQVRQNNKIVVHCALGRGRSVLLMAAYLLHRHPDWTVEQALRFINDTRQTARLNRKQRNALDSYVNDSQRRAWIIANPVSGGGKWPESKRQVIQRLSQGYVVHIRETTPDCDGYALTKEALADNPDLLMAAGGDGTVREVAAALVDKKSQIPLAILPMGTANALAHVLFGIKSKLIPVATACDAAIHGQISAIDTVTCNEQTMLLVMGIGFEQKMIEQADRKEKDSGGQFAYLSALWESIELDEQQALTVTLDDDSKQLTTNSFIVANAAPFTTLLAQGGGQPSLQDGKLDITWLNPDRQNNSAWQGLPELMLRAINGKQELDDNVVVYRQAKQVSISAAHPLKYVVDGENREADRIDIQVVPESLRVMVPATSVMNSED
ncbi:diacylglycerol kinase family protein [Aestuariibacter salexigens]|uniref:diacylglycerol kinase family protein n=1 Tax=Aestuariibacter salexigens TaxID=226010 RepID=UPI00041DBE8B|nr:diacylglycerol kinase family protein [Aestuariibacter salexigens]